MSADPIKRVELKNGAVRYRFVIDIGRDPVTGKRQQKTHTFDTKREAKSEYARIKSAADAGTYVMPSKVTVSEFLDVWLASATRDVEKATARNYYNAMLPVRDRLGSVLLQRLVESDVEGLVDWMLTSGRRKGGKPGTALGVEAVRATLGRLRAALNEAVRRQLVVRNVAAYVKIPRTATKAAAVKRAERRPWTADEVRTFLSGIADERLYAVLLLSLMGLRPAEVCGLRWADDVDLTVGRIAAGANTRTTIDNTVEEKGAKSSAGNRGLPLPAPAWDALTVFKLRQVAEKEAAGDAYEASGYVLVDELGAPQSTAWFRRRTYDLMTKVGVRRVRLYDARHACLTYLATCGVPASVIAAWAGHADGGALAMRVYVIPDESHLKAAADHLGNLLGQ